MAPHSTYRLFVDMLHTFVAHLVLASITVVGVLFWVIAGTTVPKEPGIVVLTEWRVPDRGAQ